MSDASSSSLSRFLGNADSALVYATDSPAIVQHLGGRPEVCVELQGGAVNHVFLLRGPGGRWVPLGCQTKP